MPPRAYRQKRSKKWSSRKNRRSNFVPYVSFQEKADTLGNPNNDTYTETTATKYYRWNTVPPYGGYNSITDDAKRRTVQSLKRLCADKVARNLSSLERDNMEAAPLWCLLLIWDRVLKLGNDSFTVYTTFFAKVGPFARFRSHLVLEWDPHVMDATVPLPQKQLQRLRSRAVAMNIPPNATRYRFESLFANALVSDIAYHLNKSIHSHLVVLDISGAANNIPKDNYYSILNITHLVALSVTSSRVIDDSFVGNLVSAIAVDGKLSKLRVLKMDQCPKVSGKAIHELFKRTKDYGALEYIETDHPFRVYKNEDRLLYVEGTRWYYMDMANKEVDLILRLPLGLKTHSLHKYFHPLEISPSPISTEPVLDIKIHDEIYPEHADPLSTSKLDLLTKVWTSRVQGRYIMPGPFAYAVNMAHEVQDEDEVIPKDPSRKKPKIKKTTTAKFFGL